ncbi:hypothetical protein JCM19000A_07070 [Silvimonas sp. JCM 19000]
MTDLGCTQKEPIRQSRTKSPAANLGSPIEVVDRAGCANRGDVAMALAGGSRPTLWIIVTATPGIKNAPQAKR